MKLDFGRVNLGDGNRYLLTRRSSPQGDVYVMVVAMNGAPQGSVDLEIVKVQLMQPGQIKVLDAAALERSLAEQAKAAVYHRRAEAVVNALTLIPELA